METYASKTKKGLVHQNQKENMMTKLRGKEFLFKKSKNYFLIESVLLF